MRELEYSQTLVYYDGPQLLLAHDPLGVAYVCLLEELVEGKATYLCSPVSDGRLHRLLGGDVDLREIYTTPEVPEIFKGIVLEDSLSGIQIKPVSLDALDPSWLPDPGFFLEPALLPDDEVAAEARRRKRAIVNLTLRPPESWAEPKITATNLSQGVRLFQKVITQAYRKAMRTLDAKTRSVVAFTEQYELEVFAFSPGSFTVHMQAAAPADLVNYSQIARALDILDKINAVADQPEQAVNLVAQFGGHFAAAFRTLVRFVVETETPLAYQWSMPSRDDSTRRELPLRYAGPLYDALIERVELGVDVVSLKGWVDKVDVTYGTWRLLDEVTGRPYAGQSLGGVYLAGITTKTQRYEFICEERIEEDPATGRELTKLYLRSFAPI